MKEKRYNNIDQLFRSKFNDPKTIDTDGDWNLPPEGIFNNAIDEIDSKKKRKNRVFGFWFLGGFALLAIVSAILWNTTKINTIDSEIESLKETYTKNSPKTLSTTKNTITPQEPFSSKTETKLVKKDQVVIAKSGNAIATIPQPTTSTESVFQPTRDLDQSEALNRSEALIHNNITDTPISKNIIKYSNASSSTILLNKESTQQTQFHIERLDTNSPILSISSRQLPTSPQLYNSINKENTFGKYSLFSFVGINFSSMEMSSPMAMNSDLTEYDQWYTGYQTGIGLQQRLNSKWSLIHGISYKTIRNKSLYKNNMAYEVDKEVTMQNGDRLYEASVDLNSPIGSYNRTLMIPMENVDIRNNDILSNKTHTVNDFYIINVNTKIVRTIFSTDKFTLSISAGLSANYILGMDQNMETDIYFQDKSMLLDKFTSNNKDQLNSTFFSAGLDFALEYNLTNQIFLGSEVGYQKSLKSIRKVNPTTQIKTNISELQSSFMIGIRF